MNAIASSMSLDDALRQCRTIARRRARNFYYGLRLAPEPKRSALYVLYAWMREADDIVDHTVSKRGVDAESALGEFLAQTSRALNGATDDDLARAHLWIGLDHLRRRFNVSSASFEAMIEGQRRDLNYREFAQFGELRDYCTLVASSVGILCLDIWGRVDPRADAFAIDRGIAFQLTNILRDFGEDYDSGRIYLPAEDLRRHAITPQILRTWSEPARCARFMDAQIARAREYYERSAALDAMIEPDCWPVLSAMTMIYSTLLERIASHPQRSATGKRVRLGALAKVRIAARALRCAPAKATSTPQSAPGTSETGH